jgi:chloramphenicol-sensitive protein RarD
MEIVSHRAVWSLFFCLVALGIAKQLKSTYALLKNPKVFFRLLFAAGLISVNWLVYIWGVNNEHVVETALGYYINPLIIIAFGVIMLREKMRTLQWVAVGFGALGVLVLTIDYGRLPWIALALAFSWGSYGLVKKQLNLGALEGLAIETLLSLPFYGGYLIYIGLNGTGQLGSSVGLSLLFRSCYLTVQQLACHLRLLVYFNTSHQRFNSQLVCGFATKICQQRAGLAL